MTKTKRTTQVAALRVKVKSLAAEARIIRLEEHRAKGRRVATGTKVNAKGHSRMAFGFRGRDDERRESLRFHRIRDVRAESRAALLAYAFIRGRAYVTVERPKADNKPDLERVQQLVEKFGSPIGGYPKCKCPLTVLAEWVAATLVAHPFAVEAKVA